MTGLNLTNKEMRRLIVATTVLLTIALFSTNSFSYSSDPKTFISELVNDAITTLSDKNISKKDKKEKISTVALGMYTLGQARKSLDQETLKNYQKLFEKYFLKNLTSRLTDYSSQKFEVLGAEQKSETYTIVSSRIIAGSGPEIKIDWRVYTKDPAKPLIRDLIVEGLSLAKTQKEEFASILNSNDNDINILFLKLEEFINN